MVGRKNGAEILQIEGVETPLVGAFVIGAAGLLAGFFGPALMPGPDSSLGPLTGIFGTGPFGAVLGLALGFALNHRHAPPSKQIAYFLLAGVSYGLAIPILCWVETW